MSKLNFGKVGRGVVVSESDLAAFLGRRASDINRSARTSYLKAIEKSGLNVEKHLLHEDGKGRYGTYFFTLEALLVISATLKANAKTKIKGEFLEAAIHEVRTDLKKTQEPKKRVKTKKKRVAKKTEKKNAEEVSCVENCTKEVQFKNFDAILVDLLAVTERLTEEVIKLKRK